MPAQPIVNAGFKYINGLNLLWGDDDTIIVTSGRCRDSSNVNDIILSSAITIEAANNGAAGLDIGVLGNNLLYAVYAIGSSFNPSLQSAILSLSATQPLLPSGYDMYRRVGFVRTNGTADILEFQQVGAGSDRTMYYAVSIATDIVAGNSAAYADVDLGTTAPSAASSLILDVTFTPTAADDTVNLKPKGSSSVKGLAFMSGAVGGVAETGILVCPCDSTPEIQYKVTGSAVAINTQGYVDLLV
jgi:hypothetical protein